MNNLAEKISSEIHSRSVILVGPTDSGKTYWIQNTLIPYLESQGKKVEYLRDGDEGVASTPDIVICDEVEVLFDEKYLRGDSSEPYYSDNYLNKVRYWFSNYSLFPQQTVFVVTRNKPDQIKNLIDNMHQADWDNRDVLVLEFKK